MTFPGAVAGCLPSNIDSKLLLSESWITRAAEAAEAAAAAASSTAAPPGAFNPADPQFNELARRLSKSAAMRRVQELQQTAAQQEKQLQGLTGEAKEAKKAELEESQQSLSEAQAALTELQASFEQDPLSLAPWMNALFALADSGVSTFDTGGAVTSTTALVAHPQVSLMELMAPPCAAAGGPAGLSTWLYRGHERVLGAFRRRYELERGPGLLQVTTRLALSPFGSAATTTAAELAAAAEGALEASRQAVLGPDGSGLLDTVMLHWLDYEDLQSFVAVLLSLKRFLAPPGYSNTQQEAEAAAAAAAAAADGVAPKLTALGLVQPTAEALTAALRAGVPISCISLPYSLLDTSAAPLVALARRHKIRVFASAPTAHGLISEAFIGTAQPDTAATGTAAVGCENLAAGLDIVARYGGWARFQVLLAALKAVADRHTGSASLQCVALAWLQQQGLVPLLPVHWSRTLSAATAAGGATHALKQEGAAAAAGGGSASGGSTPQLSVVSGAPWPLTLGLQHYGLDLPPAPFSRQKEEEAGPEAGAEGHLCTGAVNGGGGSGSSSRGSGVVKANNWMGQMLLGQDDTVAALAGLVGQPAAISPSSAAA